mgnify:CR=1 FL=1|tara:strand:- start:2191 stop:2508 length:318 start_codon:yes stop_codon:yes gene_type:complete
MKVYISGMISDSLDYQARFNKAEQLIREAGEIPINPAKYGSPSDQTWAYYMKEGIKELLTCDAIYMLNGWGDSRGATLERHIATQLNMPVFAEVNKDFERSILND